MAENLALSIKIGANSAEAQKALSGLVSSLKALGAAGTKANAEVARGAREARASVGGLGEAWRGARTQLLGFVAAYAGLRSLVGLIKIADEVNTLNARLKLATGSTEEFQSAQIKLFDLAQRTRSSLAETVSLYTRIAQATKDAGVGQEVLLGVVETINQAVQLSGASAQAAEAALTQLGQGLASGALRGEELNSVLEQTPALADAIAKGMGVTRGELRKLGQDGKLSAEQVVKALQAQRDEVAKQFSELPLTVGQAVTLLKNAGTQLVGAFDSATGATGGLARAIKGLADYLASDEAVGSIVEFAATWSNAFEAIVGDVRRAVEIIEQATGDIAGTGENLVQLLTRAFRQLPVNLRTMIQVATVEIAAFLDRMLSRAQFIKDAIAAVFSDDTIEAAAKRHEARLAAINDAAAQTTADALAERDAALKDAEAANKRVVAARQRARAAEGSRSPGKFRKSLSDEQKREAEQVRKAQLDAEEKLLKDSTERQLGILQQMFEDSKLSAADYYRRRDELELAALDRAIEVERQRAAAGGAERVKALADIEILERRKADVVRNSARERERAERELADRVNEIRAAELEQQGRSAEAAKIRLEAQYRDLLKRLEAEGKTEEAARVRRVIDTEAARAEFRQLESEFEQVMSRLQNRQQALTNQSLTGAISTDLAAQGQAEARQKAIADLTTLNAKLQELAERTNDPRIVEGAEQATLALQRLAIEGATGLDKALIDLRASLAQMEANFASAVTNAGVDAFEGLLNDIASGTKTAGEALRDFVRNFALSMAQIAAKAIATNLALKALEGFKGISGGGASGGGEGGGFFADLLKKGFSFLGSFFHEGGIVGRDGRRGMVPLAAFVGAPRFHSGGFPGLKSNEVPAVLQKGEEVLAKDDPRNAANGGGGAGVRIVNVLDPALAGDYLNSSAGERTVLNVLRRNAGAVKQALA